MELEGRTVIITGAARGLGASHARRFAAEGAHVALLDVGDAGDVAESIGGSARAFRADVADPDDWRRVVAEVEAWTGRVDVLVNNAGIIGSAPARIIDGDIDNVRRVLDVNVMGTYLGMSVAGAAIVRAGGGAIVNVSSIVGLRGSVNLPAYSASKWAVRGWTKSAAIELAQYGIRVNAVMPGVTDTDMVHSTGRSTEQILAQHDARLLVKRLGQPIDLTEAVLFLASDRAAYITGAELVVDGGWTVS